MHSAAQYVARRHIGPRSRAAHRSRQIEPTLLAVLINIPGMDGLILLGEIKQRFPDLPVITVTAYGDTLRPGLRKLGRSIE